MSQWFLPLTHNLRRQLYEEETGCERIVDTVLKKFRDFPDCKLYTLRYSEEMTQQYQQSYREENEYKDYEIVVYVSHFTTDPESDREGFTLDSNCGFQ